MPTLDIPERHYGYEVVPAKSFDALLHQPEPTGNGFSLPEIVDSLRSRGRLLIQAPGGSGKTTTLQRLARHLIGSDVPVLWLDLLRLPPMGARSPRLGIRDLLALMDGRASPTDLAGHAPVWVFADGVNEVGPLGNAVLAALDELAALLPNVTVVATDRLARRNLEVEAEADFPLTGKWALMTLTRIPTATLTDLVPIPALSADMADALRNAYFLTTFLTQQDRDDTPGTVTEIMRGWLEMAGGLPGSEQDAAASAALKQYKRSDSRLLDLRQLRETLGPEAVRRMLDAGSITQHGSVASFSHQLVGDYLAARFVAGLERRWTYANLDALTLKASSFDALSLVLEQISANRLEAFVRAVYDWNFYAAVFCIDRSESMRRPVALSAQVPILCMVSERRFDLFASTARRAADAVGAARSDLAKDLSQCSSREQIVEIARLMRNDVDAEWFALFSRSHGEAPAASDVDLLGSRDPVVGWAASNAIRRSQRTRSIDVALRRLLSEADRSVVRWRAAHALGAAEAQPTLDSLLAALDTPGRKWEWVRYGALRSLVEHASRSPDTADFVFGELAKRSSLILHEPLLVRDVRQSLLLSDQPAFWPEAVGRLIEELWANEDTIEGQDRWRSVAADIANNREAHS